MATNTQRITALEKSVAALTARVTALEKPPVVTPPPPVPDPPTPPVTPPPAGSVGVPAGTVLRPVAGFTASTAGKVYDGLDVSGPIVVTADDVTIRRCRIVSDALSAVVVEATAERVVIEDVEITGGYDRSITKHGTGSLTLRRVHAHGGQRNLDLTGSKGTVAEGCRFGPNANPGSGERNHASVIRAAGGSSFALRDCTLIAGAGSWSSGLIATYPEGGPNGPVTVEGGLWVVEADNDGAYGIAAGYTPPGEKPNHDFTVRDVWVSTQAYPDGCPSGVGQNWAKLTGTNTWANVRAHNPGRPDHGRPIGP